MNDQCLSGRSIPSHHNPGGALGLIRQNEVYVGGVRHFDGSIGVKVGQQQARQL
tara:strand:- start:176 stop:337 length:162 start_codon:yes stop_codon:yes gene_type:complete